MLIEPHGADVEPSEQTRLLDVVVLAILALFKGHSLRE